MKKLALYLLVFVTINSYSENLDSLINARIYYEDSLRSVIKYVGMEIGQFNSSSGFSSETNASLYIKGINKSLEIGLFIDNETKLLSGFALSHKRYVLKNYFDSKRIFEPFVYYNFIYRSTTLSKPLSNNPEIVDLLKLGSATYASIEHYVGIGIEMNMLNYFYINSQIGFGRYLGSIKNPVHPNKDTGIYVGGDGWGGMYRIGFGFRIP